MHSPCLPLVSGPTVQITGSVATPALGQSYFLTCEISGASGPVSAYQWRKGDTMRSEDGQTLSFSTLRLSDAGHYTCNASVDSVMYSNGHNVTIEGKCAENSHQH